MDNLFMVCNVGFPRGCGCCFCFCWDVEEDSLEIGDSEIVSKLIDILNILTFFLSNTCYTILLIHSFAYKWWQRMQSFSKILVSTHRVFLVDMIYFCLKIIESQLLHIETQLLYSKEKVIAFWLHDWFSIFQRWMQFPICTSVANGVKRNGTSIFPMNFSSISIIENKWSKKKYIRTSFV